MEKWLCRTLNMFDALFTVWHSVIQKDSFSLFAVHILLCAFFLDHTFLYFILLLLFFHSFFGWSFVFKFVYNKVEIDQREWKKGSIPKKIHVKSNDQPKTQWIRFSEKRLHFDPFLQPKMWPTSAVIIHMMFCSNAKKRKKYASRDNGTIVDVNIAKLM